MIEYTDCGQLAITTVGSRLVYEMYEMHGGKNGILRKEG